MTNRSKPRPAETIVQDTLGRELTPAEENYLAQVKEDLKKSTASPRNLSGEGQKLMALLFKAGVLPGEAPAPEPAPKAKTTTTKAPAKKAS